ESPRGAGVVAGQHGDTDALTSERADDLGNFWAQLVTDTDRGDRRAVTMQDHDRHALLLQTRDLAPEGARVEPARTAHGDSRSVDVSLDAMPRLLVHIDGGAGFGRCRGDRRGQGVGAVVL